MSLVVHFSLAKRFFVYAEKIPAEYPHCTCEMQTVLRTFCDGSSRPEERLALTWTLPDGYEEMAKHVMSVGYADRRSLYKVLYEQTSLSGSDDCMIHFGSAVQDMEERKNELTQYLSVDKDFDEFYQIIRELWEAMCRFGKGERSFNTKDCIITITTINK